jgi:uncharacterized membrane protein
MATGTLASQQICPEASSKAPTCLGAREVVVPEAAVRLPYPALNQGFTLGSRSGDESQRLELVSALRRTLKAKWFWYAGASSLCWTGWAFTAKIGSREIPPASMEFISAFGFVLISLFALGRTTAKTEKNRLGKVYALVSGVLLALGGICLYGAYRTGYNASTITAVTSLYPMITVLCATTFLREKLNWMQVVGLFFAAAAIFILSI